jgi:surfeit locus 1 family protein
MRSLDRPYRVFSFIDILFAVRRYSQSSDAHHKRKLWLLIIPVTTFCLGTWQVFRLQWKLNLIEDLEKKTTQSPVGIPLECVYDGFKINRLLAYCSVIVAI